MIFMEAKMDFYEVIEKRRTIRDFENIPIDKNTLEKIITAGMKAPTNDHMRDWHFIIIDNKKVVEELLAKIPKTFSDENMEKLIHDWNLNDECQANSYRIAVPKQYRMLADASCIVIPLLKQKTDILKPDNQSHLNGFASIWCCIENIFLASVAEGYGCTLRIPLGDEAEWARNVLKFPDEYFMPCFIGIGKPKVDYKPIKQKDIDIKERIHFNIW